MSCVSAFSPVVRLHRGTKWVAVEADPEQPTHSLIWFPACAHLLPRMSSEVGRMRGLVTVQDGVKEIDFTCRSTEPCLHMQLSGLQQQKVGWKWPGWPCCLPVLPVHRSVIFELICRPPTTSRELAVFCWWQFYLLTAPKSKSKNLHRVKQTEHEISTWIYNRVSLWDAVHVRKAF